MRLVAFNPVKQMKKFVAEGQWAKAVALEKSEHVAFSDERLLPVVLVAALELRDSDVVSQLVRFSLEKPVSPGIAVGLASRLITWGRPDEAWPLLERVEAFANKRQLGALCHRVSIKTANPEIQTRAKAKFLTLLGGAGVPSVEAKSSNWPTSSLAEFQFPLSSSTGPLPGRNFRFDIKSREGVHPEHAARNLELMTQFDAKIDRVPEPKVHRFDDVFVNRFGQIWRPDGTVVMSSNRPIPDAVPSAVIPNFERAILCTNATRGFYHWYAERFPSLAWTIDADLVDAPVLFGSHAAQFQDDTMSLLNVSQGGFARVGDAAYCKTVYVAHTSLACLADWDRYSRLFDTLAENARKSVGNPPCERMIYVSRRDTDRRVMRNEAELELRLGDLGVQSVVFSEHSLAEQIDLVRNATVIIGAHGAGMTHIINARSGLRVLEIMPSQPGYHSLRLNYARISRLRGHWHTLWLEPINPATKGWAVDIDQICSIAKSIIEET